MNNMFFNRNKKERTPKEKADRAQKGMIARLAGCAYLIYVVYQLLKSTFNKEETPDSTWVIVIAIVLFVLAAVVITITVIDFFRCWKQGMFRASTYEDDETADYTVTSVTEDTDSSRELTEYNEEDGEREDLDEAFDEAGGEPETSGEESSGSPSEDSQASAEDSGNDGID
jgi:hypothetical protein